jgi:Taurine catabolism dioxygenase TauD, TfdA family
MSLDIHAKGNGMAALHGGIPILDVSQAESALFDSSLAAVDIDDAALFKVTYQADLLAQVQEAAGDVFGDLADRVSHRLAEPPWFLIVRGLPAARATPILVAMSAHLGEMVEPYRQPWSRVVRHIVPSRDRVVDGRVLNEFLHTDGTDWPRPNDYTCLFCVRPDQRQDGESRLLDMSTLLDNLTSPSAMRLVERLATEPVPWRVADELGGGAHWEPVLDLASPGIRWLRYTIVLCGEEEIAPLSKDLLDDLLAFEQLVENCGGTAHTRLQAGDLMLIDNSRALHARTPIRDSAQSTRELRRTKVMRMQEPR